MTVPPHPHTGALPHREDWLHHPVAYGIRVHHLILSVIFLLLVVLGVYFITSENQTVTRTAIASYQQTELEIVRDASRSTREYVYVQTVVLNRTDVTDIEQEILKKFIEPIHLLENGDAWIYAPDHVVFDLSADFPDAYRSKSMAQIFAIQKSAGASHYEAMTDDVMHAREGVGYYIWLPEKGEEIAAWTPVAVNNYTWTIGLSTPLPEILDATGATVSTRRSAMVFFVGVSIAVILFVGWLFADIRRWRSEEILRESEERYAAIVNNAPGPVLITRQGLIIFINDAGVEAAGYSREEMIGEKIVDFLAEESREKTLMAMQRRSAGEEQISEYEAEFMRKDGGIVNLVVRAIDIMYRGELVTLSLLTDITEWKRADRALKAANRKLSLLSGITRHDIMNKLTILNGFVSLSRKNISDPARLSDFIEKEADAVAAILSLISFTKDYEELGIHAPVWQSVSGIVDAILPQLPLRDIRIERDKTDLEVYADPLLERVFYNLFENALRYGGERMTTIRVAERVEGNDLILTVEDDGAGISAEDKEKLFTKGFGRNTGLGLFLSREILSITGITISENGTPGRGARFEMRVPGGAWRHGTGTQ